MRIESGYLKQDRLCGQKNNRNAVGNFSDAMNKVRESISNKVSTRDSYVNGMDYNNFGIYTKKDRKSTRLNSSHGIGSRMPSSA